MGVGVGGRSEWWKNLGKERYEWGGEKILGEDGGGGGGEEILD